MAPTTKRRRLLTFYAILFFLGGFASMTFAQNTSISGTVTDADTGEPIPGVNILVKGTSTGASTDQNGQYELTVASLQDTLVFTYIGYQRQEIPISGRTQIDVALQSETIAGEELVVVGYGTQEKAELTSSISSVDMGQVAEKNVTTTSQLLAGESAGVSVQQASGIPGYDEAKIRIRGLGTFSNAGNDPLVLIDGVSGSLNDVDPGNIKEISVLKDAAAAAIYGSRAANGVVLVETKSGSEGELQVSYEGYVGVQEATEIPEFVNSWTYAEAVNESRTNVGQAPSYSEEDIQKYSSGENRDEYPNKFHYKDLLNSGNGLQTKHNLAFSGGSSDTQYFVSGSYLRQNGLIKEVTYDRYDLQSNINSSLTNNLQLDLKLSARLLQNHEPSWNPKIHGGAGIMSRTIRLPNTIPGMKSDGTFGVLGTMAPEAALAAPSFFRRDLHGINSKVALTWDILNNLSLEGHLGYNYSSNREKRFASEIYINENRTDDENNLTEYNQQHRYINVGSTIRYNKEVGRNDFEILGGFSQQVNKNRHINASRAGFLSTETTELNAGDAARMKSFGSSNEWRLKSLFGRLNYSYQGKYLLTGSIRYDGSSRFPEENRYGVFPSFSVGWNIADENFLKASWLDQLKLRGSWGQLGNQKIGLYPYQEVLEGGA